VLVIVAPGQGSQVPGFLAPWLELPAVAKQLEDWSALAGCDLVYSGTIADAEEIRDTAVAQPLLVAAAMAAAGALFGHIEDAPRLCSAVAGHSVGELAAGAIAGVISPDDALRLVRVRGEAMARAATTEPDLHEWHYEFVAWCEKCKDAKADAEAELDAQYGRDLVRYVGTLAAGISTGQAGIREAEKALTELDAMCDVELEGHTAADLRAYLEIAGRALRAAALIVATRQSYLSAEAV